MGQTATEGIGKNGGYCHRCRTWHVLPWVEAWQACADLMADLHRHGRIDIMQPNEKTDRRCSTAPLFAAGAGKMLGLLLGRDVQGNEQRLLAFSGMFNGLWQVDGWAEPVFNLPDFLTLHGPAEKMIKTLGAQLASLPASAPEQSVLRKKRRELSRQNMAAIHTLYTLRNFRGEEQPLTSFFPPTSGPPSGTGDCCAPKLLHLAQCLRLRPFSMAEFYWGGSSASASRIHGHRYAPCASKCQPILGFQLCGL